MKRMGEVKENDKIADVICQHTREGTIIPIKIRLMDEDGEFQTYTIRSYKDLTHYGNYVMPNGINTRNHMWRFECKIAVFGVEKRIGLFYNSLDNKWKVYEVG